MHQYEYEALKLKIPSRGANNTIAFLIVAILIASSLGLLFLSLTQSGALWFFSQLLLGITILQWFFLVHDLGHGHFFSNKLLNYGFGHLASFFVMLPFLPWRFIHRHHHLWTGWKDKDPTMTILSPRHMSLWQKRVLNFCWKFWIPIFGVSFSLSNFWNLRKLRTLFPEKMWQFVASILFVILAHAGALYLLGAGPYVRSWGLAYLVFLVISDPLLISQHGGVPQYHSQNKKVTQFHFREQEHFTRSLIFPDWMKTYIFFGFNCHGLHHLYPSLPLYQLVSVHQKVANEIHWAQWLREAKRTPAVELLFSEELELPRVIL